MSGWTTRAAKAVYGWPWSRLPRTRFLRVTAWLCHRRSRARIDREMAADLGGFAP